VPRDSGGTARGLGPHGNEWLTSSTALVLLLLALEALTPLSVRSFVSVHIFLGLSFWDEVPGYGCACFVV
jgi:hypothetical protein